MKKILKYTIFICGIFTVIALLFIHYRTPFWLPQKGAWSIGYGSIAKIPGRFEAEKYAVYSKDDLNKITSHTIFLADPFFIKEKDSFYIFFEHSTTKPDRGAEVGLMVSPDGNNYEYKGTVLEQPFHLSYPQVFKYRNEFYMLPETKQAGHILLYKAINFPYSWQICDTLIKDVKLVDPSIYLSDTLNILVVTDSQDQTMYLYQADSLFGEWKAHSKPVVLLGTESRAGGRFFVKDDKIMLPVQNASEGYGTGVSFYSVMMDKTNIKLVKEQHLVLKPSATIKYFGAGMHHIDIQKVDGGYYFVYDGNEIKSQNKTFGWKAPLKYTLYDLCNLVN